MLAARAEGPLRPESVGAYFRREGQPGFYARNKDYTVRWLEVEEDILPFKPDQIK